MHLFVEQYGKLMSASEEGQNAIRELLEASLTRIDRDATGLASRLYPWTNMPDEPRVVAVDVSVSFGRPVLADTAVPVDMILQRFRAGDTIEQLAADYRVEHSRVESVLRWAAGGTTAA